MKVVKVTKCQDIKCIRPLSSGSVIGYSDLLSGQRFKIYSRNYLTRRRWAYLYS